MIGAKLKGLSAEGLVQTWNGMEKDLEETVYLPQALGNRVQGWCSHVA